MNRGWSIVITLLMNACSGMGMFQLVADGTSLSKLFAFGAWICGNALALIGSPVVLKQGPAIAQPDSVKPASPLLALLLLAPLLAACTPAQTQAWKTAGIEVGKCIGPGLVNAAGDALVDLLTHLEQPNENTDVQAIGKGLAIKYGPSAAICAVGKAASILLPAAGLKIAPDARARAIRELLDTQDKWTKVPAMHAEMLDMGAR